MIIVADEPTLVYIIRRLLKAVKAVIQTLFDKNFQRIILFYMFLPLYWPKDTVFPEEKLLKHIEAITKGYLNKYFYA
jgi:hypothetical protein